MCCKNSGLPDGGIKPMEYYNAFRDLVKHEDTLRGERLKALLTIQSICVGIVTFALKEEGNAWLLCLVAGLGVSVALIYMNELNNGEKALEDIREKWESHSASKVELPKIIGRVNPEAKSSIGIVWAFTAFWFCVFVYSMCIIIVPSSTECGTPWQ